MHFSPIHPLFRVLILSCPLSLLAIKNPSPTEEMTKTAIQAAHLRGHQLIEQHRSLAEEEAKTLLIPEAHAIVSHTKAAVSALPQDPQKALSAIEEARADLERLFTRHVDQSFFPIEYRIEVIDTAPTDSKEIQAYLKKASQTNKQKNLVESRFYYNVLRSEINTHLYCLPLNNYSASLKEAVQQLHQHQVEEAKQTLAKALHTFVISDRVVPIPLIQAEALFAAAEENYSQDRKVSLHLIDEARHELDRAKKLGYINEDQGFALLNKSIEDLVRHVKNDKNSAFAFQSLKEKMKGMVKQLTRTLTHAAPQEQPTSAG